MGVGTEPARDRSGGRGRVLGGCGGVLPLAHGTSRIYRLPDEREWEKAARTAGTLEELGALREWTNSWQNGGRVLRSGDDPGARFFAGDDLAHVGFRIVRGMTGR